MPDTNKALQIIQRARQMQQQAGDQSVKFQIGSTGDKKKDQQQGAVPSFTQEQAQLAQLVLSPIEAEKFNTIYEMQQSGQTDTKDLLSTRKSLSEQGISTAKVDEQLKQLGYEVGASTGLNEKEKKAVNALKNLKTLFGRGNAENVGTNKDLSQRMGRGLLGNILNIGNEAATWVGFKGKTAEDIQKFKAALESAAPVFTQALGSGTPQEGEFKRLVDSAPGISSTDGEVKSWFAQMEALLSGKPLKEDTDQQSTTELDDLDEELINKYKTQDK